MSGSGVLPSAAELRSAVSNTASHHNAGTVRPTIIVGLVLALALSGCAAKQSSTQGHAGSGAQTAHVQLDQPAPPFALKDVDGRPVALSQFRGRPVFINTFATWCPPCKEELPGIVAAYPAYKDKVVFLGVDEQEDVELVKPFLRRFGITYQVALDPGTVADHYDIASLPESFFIDRAGKVVKMYRGFMTPDVLKNNLAAIVDQP
jgi:cytochrome c biogenesis protein CcmG, thiol:disulfide interchange protein DsbE